MAEQLHVLHALKVNTPLVARLVLIVTQVNTQAVVDLVHAQVVLLGLSQVAEQLHVLHALQVNTPLVARLVLIVPRVNTQAVVDLVHVRHV